MRRLLATAGLALALGVACVSGGGAEATADPDVVADVRMLAAEMERLHPNLFHSVSRAQFTRAVDELVARLLQLDRDHVLVELMRIIALAGPRDGHMGLFPLAPGHRRPVHLFPLRLWTFPEGVHVVAAPDRPDVVGARLVAIEGTPVEEVAALVRPLVSRDNESSLALRLPEFMITAEVLHGLGITRDAQSAQFTFERGGEQLDATLRPVAGPAYATAIRDIWAPPPPPEAPTPRWLRNQHRTQWLAMLERGRVVYAVYSHATESTFDFAEQLRRRARNRKVRRVIVDVRLDGGGNNTTYHPLVSALRSRAVNRPGRLVVLTGRVTYSAASNFVAEVQSLTRVRIVGEAAGGSPHNFGETTQVVLPALGWTVHVPTEFVEVLGRRDDRVAIEPDVPVQIGVADHFAGRDPVLARAIALR